MKTSERYYDLWKHLLHEHELTLLDSQLEEIIRIVNEMEEDKKISKLLQNDVIDKIRNTLSNASARRIIKEYL